MTRLSARLHSAPSPSRVQPLSPLVVPHTDSIGCYSFSESLGKPDWSEAFPTNVHSEVQITPTHQS